MMFLSDDDTRRWGTSDEKHTSVMGAVCPPRVHYEKPSQSEWWKQQHERRRTREGAMYVVGRSSASTHTLGVRVARSWRMICCEEREAASTAPSQEWTQWRTYLLKRGGMRGGSLSGKHGRTTTKPLNNHLRKVIINHSPTTTMCTKVFSKCLHGREAQ